MYLCTKAVCTQYLLEGTQWDCLVGCGVGIPRQEKVKLDGHIVTQSWLILVDLGLTWLIVVYLGGFWLILTNIGSQLILGYLMVSGVRCQKGVRWCQEGVSIVSRRYQLTASGCQMISGMWLFGGSPSGGGLLPTGLARFFPIPQWAICRCSFLHRYCTFRSAGLIHS